MALIADRAAQIPTDGYPTVTGGEPVNSSETGRNIANALAAVPGAGPAMISARALAGASKVAPVASNLISSLAQGVAPIAPIIPPLAGGAGLIAASGTPAASPTSNVQTPALVKPPATTAVSPAATDPAIAQTAATTSVASPGVISRVGNTYSGTNIGAGATIDNPRNPGAGVTVLPGAGLTGGSPILDRALSEARNAAASRGDFDAVARSYNDQGQAFAGVTNESRENDRLKDLANSPPGTAGRIFARSQLRDRMTDATTRRGQDINAAQIAGSNIIAGKRLELQTSAANLDMAGKKRLQAAQDAYINAKTQVEKDAAAEAIRALSGKNELPNRYTVVPGGQSVDPSTGLAITQPAQVLDNSTGALVDLTGQRPSNATPKFEKGKVYTDAKGKKATWDGTKFVPST